MQALVYALHGFLGQGTDWLDVFQQVHQNDHVACPNYFSDDVFPQLVFDDFVQDIERHIDLSFHDRKIFMGYSLGGRIGLKLLEAQPDLFDHYVFISTHPGLSTEAEKKQRLASDQKWIEKLQTSAWSDFLKEWDNQGVLKNSETTTRIESDYRKDRLIKALSDYSLGHQKDYSELLRQHQNRITWIVGHQDEKFLKLAEELKQKKILLDYKRILSGHRILFDNPIDLARELGRI